jgi:molecular chaperone DnaK (HSP70)
LGLINDLDVSNLYSKCEVINAAINETFTPEELVAFTISYAKKMAENYAYTEFGATIQITDLILTVSTCPTHYLYCKVPPFFTYEQRKTVHEAAAIANINLLGIIDDYTAGMFFV